MGNRLRLKIHPSIFLIQSYANVLWRVLVTKNKGYKTERRWAKLSQKAKEPRLQILCQQYLETMSQQEEQTRLEA
jgi:spermidine synthase